MPIWMQSFSIDLFLLIGLRLFPRIHCWHFIVLWQKHPKIEFDIDNKGPVSISDYTALLDSMTLEDAKGLRTVQSLISVSVLM